jgi:hypothetical protein
MADYKILHGILALIDIVNFTPQATKLGEENTQKYTAYFQDKVTDAAGKHGFQVIKSMGDAVLIFGTDAEDFLEIMKDLIEREKLEDRFGFKSQYRMVGHSGFFQFQMEGGRPVDLVSPEGIKLFRMEKIAHSWELVVTPALYQGIQPLLTSKNLEALRLVLAEPLKGFDNLEWPPLFYKLRIAREQERVSNLLEPRLERLEQEVQEIPVFGNIYPPVPMENNFINLSLVCGEPYEDFRGITDGGSPPRKGRIARGIPTDIDEFNQKLLRGVEGGGFLEKSPPLLTEITVSQLYEHFSSGVILGLPGAVKTTILRYLAFRVFQANKTTGNQPRVVLFVPCRDVPLYDSWYKKRFAVEPSAPTIGEVLEFMTWVFLEGKSDPGDLTPARWVEFQETGKRVKQASREDCVTLLVERRDKRGNSPIFFLRFPSRVFATNRNLTKNLEKFRGISGIDFFLFFQYNHILT